MKILILGIGGMLGHQLAKHFSERYNVYGTSSSNFNKDSLGFYFPKEKIFQNIDVLKLASIEKIIQQIHPDIVINAVGVIKQRDDAKNAQLSIDINALFPHQLTKTCAKSRVRVIHFSTDCVFSGNKGNYHITDIPDAEDIYGKTKFLGEVSYLNSITLRTSIIGLELKHKKSLIEWFLSQKGDIRGYTNAIYTGFTTIEMARIVEMLIFKFPELNGIYHVASEPIDKFRLLKILSGKLQRNDISIIPEEHFKCDRSLSANEFNELTHYQAPSWDEMLFELADHIIKRGDKFI